MYSSSSISYQVKGQNVCAVNGQWLKYSAVNSQILKN